MFLMLLFYFYRQKPAVIILQMVIKVKGKSFAIFFSFHE